MKVSINEFEGKKRTNIQVSRVDTKGKIMDIQDATSYTQLEEGFEVVEKVMFSMTDYGSEVHSHMKHYMDLDDFMVLCNDIQWKQAVNYVEYKGSKSDKYSTGYEARQLSIGFWKDGDQGKGAYTLELVQGPGQPGDKGQVSPVKGKESEQKKLKMVLSIPEARRAFLSSYNYFNNKQTAVLCLNYNKWFVK